MKLNKKIGGRRHREWAWALVVIALCTAAVAWWGAQEPSMAPGAGMTPTTEQSPAAGKPSGVTAVSRTDASVAGVLATIPEASTFNYYFKATNVGADLGSGLYTVFVPENAAFANLAKGSVSGLSSTAQKRLVQYHVVAGKMLDTDAVLSGNYQALSKDTLNFSVDLNTGVSYVGTGKILKAYRAQNGIIYVISSVLFPPR